MRRYLGYIRVSTPKQGILGSSLQEQKSAIEAYAVRHGLTIGGWFEERETAAKQGREMFAKMIAELDRGTASGVIIHKIDRSARNLKDWANLGELIDRGADVRFAHDGLDLSSRGGRLSADIQAVVAADFIRNLREEVKKGFYGRLKQGIYPLRAPIGYIDMGKGQAKQFDPERAPLVREAFSLYASGEMNFHALREELTRRGLTNRDGRPVSLNGLTTMLNNPFYVGLIHLRKTNEVFEGVHTPLITKALYDQVQGVLRGYRVGTPWKHDFVFRRLIRCFHCGGLLTGERKKERYVYYRCHTNGCSGACVKEEEIDCALKATYAALRPSERDVRDIGLSIESLHLEQRDEKVQFEASLRIKLTNCDQRLTRLTDALLDGVIDKDIFESQKAHLLAARRDILDRIDHVSELPGLAHRVTKLFELLNTAYLQYENGNSSEKRAVVRLTTSNFCGDGKNPAITLRSPFHEIRNAQLVTSGELRQDRVRTVGKIYKLLLKAARAEFKEEQKHQAANDNPRPIRGSRRKSPSSTTSTARAFGREPWRP